MANNRKALCVGINNFKNYPGNALQGCINDANDMEALLKKYLGFTGADIVKLTDAKATKVNIMKNLKQMVKDAKAGKYDYLVFSMSSHGTQMADLSGDDPDRLDEAFCPHDLAVKGNAWDPKCIIVDDELRDLFIQLPKDVLLEVYLDTCHSGTGLKALELSPDRQPRYMPPPSGIDVEQPRGLNQALEEEITHHILWAACRADQTSADANIEGGWHGAFTYFFCKEMNASQNKLSRDEILNKVRSDLRAAKYDQIPQLESEATSREKSAG